MDRHVTHDLSNSEFYALLHFFYTIQAFFHCKNYFYLENERLILVKVLNCMLEH